MSGTYVRQDRNEAEDSNGNNDLPERPISAPAGLDIHSDNLFSFLPNTAGYGGIFSDFQSGYSYQNHQEDIPDNNNSKNISEGFGTYNNNEQPKYLWDRFSALSVNSDDLSIEEHLLPDLSSDPDVSAEAPSIVSDEDLMRAVREMRQGGDRVNYDNRYRWDQQREMNERNNPMNNYSQFAYENQPMRNSLMSQLLPGSQITGPSMRNDYGAPGTFPSQTMMNLRNPMNLRHTVTHGPQYPNELSTVDTLLHLMQPAQQSNPSPQNMNGGVNSPLTHHRTTSTDSYMANNFFQKSYTAATPLVDDIIDDQIISNSPVCRYFAAGYCIRGDRCNFAHIRPEATQLPRKEELAALKDKNKNKFTNPVLPSGTQRQNGGRRRINNPVSTVVPDLTKKPIIDGKSDDILARFHSIEQVQGHVYRICKDQHGCRFLQKKLEEKDKNPRSVEIIFTEVYDHMVELMTDPFGNYLCQKLIEHCSEQQQLFIVQKVAPHLVNISKNMHGTRAVQKMIECLCTPSQVQLVVNALKSSVVPLIQDLNGNHVIQRCLNRLSEKDKQFVYDAVAANCVEVATHRHGCCVMQRCIDYASEEQKLQLVREIAKNVLTLVQDPFGNYVVQYILDLPFSIVKINLIQKFLGNLAILSTQKFSSNVIEKCLHVADEKVKIQLIDELMQPHTLGGLLQDPYGNYVIQTALTESKPNQRLRLIDEIKPLLPVLRNTPYGKRIQNKIAKDGEP